MRSCVPAAVPALAVPLALSLVVVAGPAAGGAGTVVHVVAPAGTSLCISGERAADGVVDFRLAPDVYLVTAFGAGRPRTETTLDLTAGPAAVELSLPVPPTLTGDWSGRLGPDEATLRIETTASDQPDCERDPQRPDGLAGALGCALDGVPRRWTLRAFDWDDEQRRLECVAGAPDSAAGDAASDDLTLWLVLRADGALEGSYLRNSELYGEADWLDVAEDDDDPATAAWVREEMDRHGVRFSPVHR